jgi:DNA-binding MarR family transcriptional regulator
MNGPENMKANTQELAAMAEEIDLNLRELRRALRKPIENEAARAGITWPQRNAMQVLVRSDGLNLKELSKRMGLAHATVSGIVDRLEKRGLVERKQDSSDGRFTNVLVSDPVRKFMKTKLNALMIDPLREALRQTTPAERRKIREGLRILRRVTAGTALRFENDELAISRKAKR